MLGKSDAGRRRAVHEDGAFGCALVMRSSRYPDRVTGEEPDLHNEEHAMARIAIVYGTGHGHTATIARHMAKVLAGAGHTVDTVDANRMPRNTDLSQYRGIIVGANVRAGRHNPGVARFVRRNRPLLERVPSAFFSVSLTAASTKPEEKEKIEKIVAGFLEETGWRPAKAGIFAGALLYTKLGRLQALLWSRIIKLSGFGADISRDYDYTDWQGVTEFAKAFASMLPREVQAGA
jgi:menaquinone-dependent protoporphyrinogen oxidase